MHCACIAQASCQVKTLGLGCADLEKYNQALDKALVAYHAEKMQEVNEIAQNLWTQVTTHFPHKRINFLL